jgi:hypothetical protein
MDPNTAFPFQDDFSVGTINEKNMTPSSKDHVTDSTPNTQAIASNGVIEITDDDNDINIPTSKTQDKLLALLLQERQKSKSIVSSWAASGSESPVSGPTANATLAGAAGKVPIAAEGTITSSNSDKGSANGGPVGK